MPFTFLHAADLHLGSPLHGLSLKDPEIARRVGTASREAYSDLVTQAIERKVAFLVIAGDIYDGEWKDTSIGLYFAREMARLERANISVFIVRGNHDAESVVTKTITLPGNVREFSTRKVETFLLDELKVALHGRSFPDRAVSDNWALTYPAPKSGYLNIGVLHTSCDGRPGHETYAPCTVEDLARRGYDYFALGHVHEYEVLSADPYIVFPGNLQGRSTRERGPKGAVLINVEDGRVTGIERLLLDRARFEGVDVDLAGHAEETQAFAALEQAMRPVVRAAEGRLLALRVRLSGATELHRRFAADRARIFDEVQAAAQRLHEDVWIEKLHLDTREPARPEASAASAGIDLAALLDECRADPELLRKIQAELATLDAKMPGLLGADAAPESLETLLAEAEASLLGRALGTGIC